MMRLPGETGGGAAVLPAWLWTLAQSCSRLGATFPFTFPLTTTIFFPSLNNSIHSFSACSEPSSISSSSEGGGSSSESNSALKSTSAPSFHREIVTPLSVGGDSVSDPSPSPCPGCLSTCRGPHLVSVKGNGKYLIATYHKRKVTM